MHFVAVKPEFSGGSTRVNYDAFIFTVKLNVSRLPSNYYDPLRVDALSPGKTKIILSNTI